MNRILDICKALGDEARLRALLALRDGELCLCQVVELLQLAPSTVSKHMTMLHRAGIVELRKHGRWHYYRLPGPEASPMVREVLDWLMRHTEREQIAVSDAARLCCIRETDPAELTNCYRTTRA